MKIATYDENSIKSLEPREHMRLRPGMYIGKLGDGTAPDDGIYVLVKEIVDNSIDEYTIGFGKSIDIEINDGGVRVRDHGRGIPLGKIIDCVSKINTGAKYNSNVFQKSVGLNGVGSKAVNALSSYFRVSTFRGGKKKVAEFERGVLVKDYPLSTTGEKNGTEITFYPDEYIFKGYHFVTEFLEEQIWDYVFLNAGLVINYNQQKFFAENGLLDLLKRKITTHILRYPIIHLKANDIEIAFTHTNQYAEIYYSFVNGQNTTRGGTHLAAFKEAIVKTLRDHFNKNFDTTDVRSAIVGAIAIRMQEPIFESQTKTKLGSIHLAIGQLTVRSFVNDFIKKALDNFLHKHPQIAREILKRVQQSERERKEIAGIKRLANERTKKANLHNKKLRDCRLHFNEKKGEIEKLKETTLFITEGDSASGSITQSRNVMTQAVFSLRGKPLNACALTKKVVYQNEEFNLLQHALNIENGLEHLRYNRVVVATDADVDGMHIRLLMLTFFLQFFPDLVKNGHVYILDTPLFRVRNKKKTIYCYSEKEKHRAIKKLASGFEVTRFKGLGEISPQEFSKFIGENMRLSPVRLDKDTIIQSLLNYYMGKNTAQRQNFIIDNLKIEKDAPTVLY